MRAFFQIEGKHSERVKKLISIVLGLIFVGVLIFSHLSHGWRTDPCALLLPPARQVSRRMDETLTSLTEKFSQLADTIFHIQAL